MASPLDVPNPPSDTVLLISSKINISCPASHAFETLIDTSTWHEWNSFCPQVETTPPPSSSKLPNPEVLRNGSHMTMHVRMTPGSSLREQKLSVVELTTPTIDGAFGQPHRVCWRIEGMPHFVLRTLRTSELHRSKSSTGEPMCEYRTWESMAGPSAYIVKKLYGDSLQSRFEEWADDLKAYAEKTWQAKSLGSSSGI